MQTTKTFKKALLAALIVAALALLLIPLLCLPVAAETEGYYTYTVSSGEATITDVDTAISGDVVIPDTLGGYPVTSIGNSAFFGCSFLTSIEIPSSVTSIGRNGFWDCSSLTSIQIPSSVTSIDYAAFDSCSSLMSVYIEDLVAWCGISFGGANANPLYYAKNLYLHGKLVTDLVIPEDVTSIGDYAFYRCSSFTSVEIPSSVTSIGSHAFWGCTSLTNVEIPSSVTSIGPYAFTDCPELTSITVDSANTTYHSAGDCLIETESKILIAGCKNSVIPADGSVTSINYSAFEGCTSLISIEIPSSVTSIGNYAFTRCSSLISVTIPAGVETLNGSVFSYSTSLESISFAKGSKLADFALPYDCPALSYVYFDVDCPLPSLCSFGDSSLKEIVIPNAVTSIEWATFKNCLTLENVIFGEESQLSVIKNEAFSGCTRLSSIEIPDTVSSIEGWAFWGCSSLENISVPLSVVSVGEGAFAKCNSLSTVYYGGAKSDWMNISVASNNAPLLEANIVYALCDSHSWNDGEVTTAPTFSSEGIKTYSCSECSATKTETLAKTPAISANVLLGESFAANGKVRVPDVTATEAGLYVDGVKMTGVLTDGYYLVENFFKCAAKETGKTVTVQAYYVADGVEVKGNEIETSVAALLRTYLSNSDADVVALATATLNYAAAAQVYFNYDVENLVNGGLAATLPQGEYTDNFAVIEANPDAILAPREIALLLNDTVDLHVRAGKLISPAVNYAEYYLAVSENADMSDATTVAFDEKGIAVVKAISPTKWNDTYYFCIVDGEGNAVSATFSYGVSTYYARMAADDDANLTALVDAMMALYEANEAYLAPDVEEPYVPEGNQTHPDDISGIF